MDDIAYAFTGIFTGILATLVLIYAVAALLIPIWLWLISCHVRALRRIAERHFGPAWPGVGDVDHDDAARTRFTASAHRVGRVIHDAVTRGRARADAMGKGGAADETTEIERAFLRLLRKLHHGKAVRPSDVRTSADAPGLSPLIDGGFAIDDTAVGLLVLTAKGRARAIEEFGEKDDGRDGRPTG